MPYKFESIAINSPLLDRRYKLLDCQKERIKDLHHRCGYAMRFLARMFNINRTTVKFICYPDAYERNKQLYKERGGSMKYYTKEKQAAYMRKHRANKKTIKHILLNENN